MRLRAPDQLSDIDVAWACWHSDQTKQSCESCFPPEDASRVRSPSVTDIEQFWRTRNTCQRTKRLDDARRLSVGCARVLIENSKPCRCSGISSFGHCHLWHNYRPLKEPVEDLIERLALLFDDSSCIIVALAPAIVRFCKNEGINLCKDQFLRLISISICVNAKFWDDMAPGRRQNARIAAAVGVPLDDFNAMEMAFLRGLHWNVCIGRDVFDHWTIVMEDKAEMQRLEILKQERRNSSPTEVTLLADPVTPPLLVDSPCRS